MSEPEDSDRLNIPSNDISLRKDPQHLGVSTQENVQNHYSAIGPTLRVLSPTRQRTTTWLRMDGADPTYRALPHVGRQELWAGL